MPIQNYDDLNENQMDLLREIGNIGCGNATTALSSMLNRKISMKEPMVKLTDISSLDDLAGGAENPVVAILMTITGDINGMMIFIMNRGSARHLANLVLGRDDVETHFDHMDFSALKEIGNIISGAYMTSLSTLLGISVRSSVPQVSCDMAGAVLSVPAIEFGKLGDKALIIDSKFDETDDDVDGFFILIPDLESYNRIFSKVGM